MVDIGEILKNMLRLHPEFSLKIGQKAGALVAEMRIANHKPAIAMGSNLVLVLNQVHGEAVRNIADRLLAESRLSDAVFDNAVSKLEDPCHCCCGCNNKDEDDKYYDEYSEDLNDDSNY
jgi:hypothetical protein